jgi:NADP-dependent 3-hydroxy acid dehydrogenase YdfG
LRFGEATALALQPSRSIAVVVARRRDRLDDLAARIRQAGGARSASKADR